MPEQKGVRLRVEKLVAGGDGLAFHEGKAVFVPFALPGETVLARMSAGKRDFTRAELVEVVEPSPHRVAPSCPLYGVCGGCNLQHLAYPRQAEEKALIVAEAFSRTARIDAGKVEAVPSVPFGYRNRMQLHFTRERRLGFMRRSSSEAIEAPSCPVACDSIRRWIEQRAGTSRAYEELAGVLEGRDRFQAFGYGEEAWIEGQVDYVEAAVAGEKLRFHVRSFFQSNLYLLDRFVPEVLEGLEGGRAADLYCGIGLFGHFLSSRYRELACVEQDRFALGLAKTNAGGEGHEFFAQSIEEWVKSRSAGRTFDLILVDPPRMGLAPQVRAWLVASRCPIIVYVSCDPVTLARDSGELVRGGYELAKLKAFDFYPQTNHVECYARFLRR
jgi:SAM-dependent methyltransferases related to tRNA (uracil-5-)-methyltransferase